MEKSLDPVTVLKISEDFQNLLLLANPVNEDEYNYKTALNIILSRLSFLVDKAEQELQDYEVYYTKEKENENE